MGGGACLPISAHTRVPVPRGRAPTAGGPSPISRSRSQGAGGRTPPPTRSDRLPRGGVRSGAGPRPLAPRLRKRRPRRGGEGSTGEESWRKSSRRWLPPRPLTALDGSHRRPRWDIRMYSTCTTVLYKSRHGLRPYDVGGVGPLPATRCTTSRWMDGRVGGAGECSLQGVAKREGERGGRRRVWRCARGAARGGTLIGQHALSTQRR